MDIREKIKATIDNDFTNSDIITLWNEYCKENSYFEDMIFDMYMLDEMADSISPTEVLNRYGDVNTNQDYFVEGIYGAQSFDFIDDENSPIYMDDLIDWIIRTEHDDFAEVFENEED